MRAVIQRASSASVLISGGDLRKIGHGLVILLGIESADDESDIEWLSRKILQMRIFGDEQGRMNRSVLDVQGDILLVSQFTLHASTKKGNRPSFIRAAKPEHSLPLYEAMKSALEAGLSKQVRTGEFGAMMTVSLDNNGPVTIVIDSKQRE